MSEENMLPFPLAEEETLSGQQIVDAVLNGVNPYTGKVDDGMQDELRDEFFWGYGDRELETPLGPIVVLRSWNNGDGRDMGIVTKHIPTGRVFLAEGTYSSWDGSDYDSFVEAEEYTYTETRWRPKS